MPPKKKKGKHPPGHKARKGGGKKDLIYPEGDEMIARVIKREGGKPPTLKVICTDDVERVAVIRGSLMKRAKCFPGTLVLVVNSPDLNSGSGLDKVYVVHKYHDNDHNILRKEKLVTDEFLGLTGQTDRTDNDSGIIIGMDEDAEEAQHEHTAHEKKLIDSQMAVIATQKEILDDDSDDDFNLDDFLGPPKPLNSIKETNNDEEDDELDIDAL